MAALTLEGFGSDDEDDDTLSSLPQTDAMATTFEKQDMNAFMLSQVHSPHHSLRFHL
jgi:hypothetical protein